MPYCLITVPLGIVAFALAHAPAPTPLKILAVVAGLSPLLIVWRIYAVMTIVYVVTGGAFPGPE